jgi:hypothetical protein
MFGTSLSSISKEVGYYIIHRGLSSDDRAPKSPVKEIEKDLLGM